MNDSLETRIQKLIKNWRDLAEEAKGAGNIFSDNRAVQLTDCADELEKCLRDE